MAADEESQLRGSIISSIASSHLVIEAWKKNRVIYCLDQQLTEQLSDTDQTTVIPGEVFRYVPHPDPLVLFDTPIPVEGEDETEQLLGSSSVV